MKSQHIRMNSHADQSLIICNKCVNKKFTSEKALHIHQNRTHHIIINERYLRLISKSMKTNIKHHKSNFLLIFSARIFLFYLYCSIIVLYVVPGVFLSSFDYDRQNFVNHINRLSIHRGV
jgi:hypothetical protein